MLFYFFWLAGQAFSVLTHYWVVSVTLIAGMAASVLLQYFFFTPKRWCVRHLFVFVPLSVSVVILLLGTVFDKNIVSARFVSEMWVIGLIWSLVIVQVVVSICVVWAMKGVRWFSVFATGLQLFFALGCAFVSVMSVTGDWL